MLASQYASYEELRDSFSYNDIWEYVDGHREEFNVTEHCIDQNSGVAVRTIRTNDGSTSAVTFEEISRHAAQFAHFLDDHDVEPGQTAALMLDPSIEFLAGFFGTIKQGSVALPCSELFGPDAIEYRLQDSEPKLLLTTEAVTAEIDTELVREVVHKSELLDRLTDYPETYEADTADKDDCWIQYTSGTTGRPTAITFQHESIPYNAVVKDLVLDFAPKTDTAFTTSSVGWGSGIWSGLFSPLFFGVPTGFYNGKFDPEIVLEAIEEFPVNTLIGIVPTALRSIVEAARDREDSTTLEKINYSGEPIDEGLSRDVEKVLGAFPRSIYGATELRSNVTADFAVPGYEFRHGSMGKPLPGIDVKIVDEEGVELPPGEIGRIVLRRSGDWIETEDNAWMDRDGYLWSSGRADDTIISAGYTIGPQEVEDTIRKHDAVDEVGVIGIPDEERGQVVKAFIATTSPQTEELKRELQDYVKSELSKHEYPREIEFSDAIPVTPDGKIKRSELRKRHGIDV